MEVRHAEYMISSPSVEKCPPADAPEYAFIGRSNVGKSSLINRLSNRKNLAKTSSTPGKTLMINHFSINRGAMYWTDLPGYGYDRRSKKIIGKLEGMIYSYLKRRKNLLTTFVLIDSRRTPQDSDLKFVRWCGAQQIPIIIAFTKADKQGEKHTRENMELFREKLYEDWDELPPQIITSAKNGEGCQEVLQFMHDTNTCFVSDP